MYLKIFFDDALAQTSYMVGSLATGEAIVLDPARDVTPYLEAAAARSLRIVQVAETHIHADFVSGARELVARTGARLVLSGMGGADWRYAYADANTTVLSDGDAWMLGTVRFEALHMPGHTPEHLIFRVTDTAHADEPIGLFTGDCLFVGDVGRPDLLETAAGVSGTSEDGARRQFANVQRLKTMPDYWQVWPGHGAGSACGKALGSMPSTTLGYEKRFSPAFQFDDEADFVAWLLHGQPETPRYFARMKHVNRLGPTLLADVPEFEPMEGFVLPEVLKSGALVVDARAAEEFQYAHVPGTLSVPLADKFSTYAGEFVRYDQPTYLIVEASQVERAVRALRAIGVDYIPGYFEPREIGGYTQTLISLAAAQLAALPDALIVDVRSEREYRQEHVPGALHLPLEALADRAGELSRDRMIVTQCESGARSQIAASYLQMQGFGKVANLRGGMGAWEAAGLPLERAGQPTP